MKNRDIENISAVISYIEDCVKGDRPAGRCEGDKLDLDRIAAMFHYSKFYLHRMFTQTAGITIHDYIRRRQLTEAARWLVFSEKAILEIALAAGYESQQAFTGVFKSMYKKTPMEYKRNRMFYPLQLKLDLNRNPLVHGDLAGEIAYVGQEDIPAWMEFVSLVIDGFPGYDEEQHRRQLVACVEEKQAFFMRDGATMIGAAAFSRQDGRIDFLGIHPQYRRYETGRKLLDFMLEHVFAADREEISITTFREGDRADTGQRAEYRKLGFGEAELLVEFGYPTQRMVLRRGGRGDSRKSGKAEPEEPGTGKRNKPKTSEQDSRRIRI